MSGAHLSFLLFSRLYFVRGLVKMVWRLMIKDINVCVTLFRQVCHSMTSSPSLKTSNRFAFFSLFKQYCYIEKVSHIRKKLKKSGQEVMYYSNCINYNHIEFVVDETRKQLIWTSGEGL